MKYFHINIAIAIAKIVVLYYYYFRGDEMSELLYFREDLTEIPSNEAFALHSHDNYEIYLFLDGDTRYIVDGRSYTLKPYDMIIIRKAQMHRVFHNSPSRYKRFVINISPKFFDKYKCPEYQEQFWDTENENKIDGEVVLASGIYDAFLRLKKYSGNVCVTDTPINVSIVTEILYLLSKTKTFVSADTSNTALAKVIDYINENYREDISLDELEKKFFISKYHLCHAFKAATGLTVHAYIMRKRLNYVKELIRESNKIGEACAKAGFKSYSSFYRAYVREYGAPPKIGLEHYKTL